MTDSNGREALDGKHERNRARRIEAIKRWVRHIQETPPDQWGREQNALVNAQVRAARETDLDAAHRRRVERVARELAERDE